VRRLAFSSRSGKIGSLLVSMAVFCCMAAGARAQMPKSGGTLQFAVVTEPPNYDCHGNTNFGVSHTVFPHYSRLLKFEGDWRSAQITGDLAETWTISADGLVYTFKLLPGVKFHDGSVMTSADVKASYERIIKPPPGVLSARQALYQDVKSIETPDPKTVVFQLTKPNGSMLDAFASPWNCIYSAARLKENPKYPETAIMGTGPFVFVNHVKGQSLEGKRFDGYFRQGLPYLDGFKAFYVKSAALTPGLSSGQFDIEFRGLSPAERDQVTERLKDNVVTLQGPWSTALTITFNTKRKPFDDVRVRQALTMAIDRWGGSEALSRISLLKHVGGFTRPGSNFALPEAELVKLPGFSKDIEKARTTAKSLLAEAGVTMPKIALLNRDTGQPYIPAGIFVMDQWKRIGLDTEHKLLDAKLYYDALSRGDFDAAIDFVSDFSDEPNLFYIRLLSHGQSPVSYAQHSDTVIDTLFDQQQRALDASNRRRLTHLFEQHALTQAYNVPLLWWQRIVVHHKKIKGWRLFASHHLGQDLAEVWLDQ
jgi:peptide/nickel transport system substrate-binding protein